MTHFEAPKDKPLKEQPLLIRTTTAQSASSFGLSLTSLTKESFSDFTQETPKFADEQVHISKLFYLTSVQTHAPRPLNSLSMA